MDKEVIQWLKEFAPQAWKLAIHQTWIEVWVSGIGVFIFLSAFIMTLLWGKKKEQDNCIITVLLTIFGVFTFAFMLIFFLETIPRILNPEFYALMKLKP